MIGKAVGFIVLVQRVDGAENRYSDKSELHSLSFLLYIFMQKDGRSVISQSGRL